MQTNNKLREALVMVRNLITKGAHEDGIFAVIDRALAAPATAKKSLVVGNAAKLREALAIAKKAICNHARANHTCDSLAWESSTINANCGDILCGHRDLCEAKTAIQKALAAPARNCDRFDSFPQAFDEWYKTEVLPRVHGVVGGVEPPFDSWLFLTVTNRKGENNEE